MECHQVLTTTDLFHSEDILIPYAHTKNTCSFWDVCYYSKLLSLVGPQSLCCQKFCCCLFYTDICHNLPEKMLLRIQTDMVHVKIISKPDEDFIPKRLSGALLHTLSELYDVPVGIVPIPSFVGVYCFIRGRKGGCCSLSDDLSCSWSLSFYRLYTEFT